MKIKNAIGVTPPTIADLKIGDVFSVGEGDDEVVYIRGVQNSSVNGERVHCTQLRTGYRDSKRRNERVMYYPNAVLLLNG